MLLIIEFLFILILAMTLFTLYRNEIAQAKGLLPRGWIEGFWNGRERRQHKRFKETLEVIYTVTKRTDAPQATNNKATTANISEGGVNLILDEKLSKGTILNIHISLPGKMAELEGQVVWCDDSKEKNASGKRLFCSGIKFLAIKESSKSSLMDYLNSLPSVSEI